jgi:hypothetical protein
MAGSLPSKGRISLPARRLSVFCVQRRYVAMLDQECMIGCSSRFPFHIIYRERSQVSRDASVCQTGLRGNLSSAIVLSAHFSNAACLV